MEQPKLFEFCFHGFHPIWDSFDELRPFLESRFSIFACAASVKSTWSEGPMVIEVDDCAINVPTELISVIKL